MGKNSSTKHMYKNVPPIIRYPRRPVLRAWLTMSRAVTALTNPATSACARANEGNDLTGTSGRRKTAATVPK